MSDTPIVIITGGAQGVGNVVAFLTSPRASNITGETIYVEGDRLGMNNTC